MRIVTPRTIASLGHQAGRGRGGGSPEGRRRRLDVSTPEVDPCDLRLLNRTSLPGVWDYSVRAIDQPPSSSSKPVFGKSLEASMTMGPSTVQPFTAITSATETAEGLFVAGQLDLENARAVKVYEAMLAGTLREFSIGFGIVEKHWGEIDGKPVRYLDVLELLEISVVWKGAAYGTRLVEVRSAPVPEPQDELAEINARLDALASDERPRDPDAASAVDQLVLEVREELIRESLDRAEQAAWQERMRINMVLDPVPVRVDARMRPVTT